MATESAVVITSKPWLAISFGCCASHDRDESDEHTALRNNDNDSTEMRICYDQPQLVPQPRAVSELTRPSTSHSMGRHMSQWVSSGREFAARASSRASTATLHRPRASHAKGRPSISRPSDFRKFDKPEDFESMMEGTEMPVRRRGSFRPLELSIYLPDGRLSPLPDFTDFSESEWNKLPAELEIPAQALTRDRDSRTNSVASNPSTTAYLIQRKPIGSGSRRSSMQSSDSASRPVSVRFPQEEPLLSRPDSLASGSVRRSSTRNSNHSTSARRMLSRLPSPSRSRSNTEPMNLLSPSSLGSLRKPKCDVDEAIRELNTIVEERRAEAYRSATQSPALFNRPPPSPSHHVPAIAPSLRMHVRSETLSDIGSAFSVPLPKALPPPPPPPSKGPKLRLSPPARQFTSGPLTSNPITPPTPTVPTPTTPIGRLGAWLKRSLPTTPTTPSFLKSATPQKKPSTPSAPFYQCTPAVPSVHNSSRPSTAGSRTLTHTRQDSNDTATVTLISSYPSTPSLTSRAASPEPTMTSPSSPQTPGNTPDRGTVLKGAGKTRRVPAPLNLGLSKEKEIEAGLTSGGLTATHPANRGLVPPRSPNFDLLKGMEVVVSPGRMEPSPVTPVGLAF